MKRLIKKAIDKLNYKVIKKRNYRNAFQDQKRLLGLSNSPITIFDVGAYDGMISLKYNELFPNSEIHSFEPFQESFLSLKQNTSNYKNIKVYNQGLGDYTGVSKFHSNKFAPTNSILATHEDADRNWGNKNILSTKEVVDINITTVDEFVERNSIEKIDILKLDVQGAEYMVLNGGKKTIEEGKIKLIYTEMISIPTYQNQKELGEVMNLFTQSGFSLFNIYHLSHTGKRQLRFFDAIFINSKALNL